MNLCCTSLLHWKMSKIPFSGGMRNRRHTLAFFVWPWTILVFPVCLHAMLLFPLTDIASATSVDVERLFSCGQLVLSHTYSRLSVASTHALLCLGSWSLAGLVRNEDVEAAVKLDEVNIMLELNRLAEALACIIL